MLNIPEYLIVHHTGGTAKDPLADTSHHTFEGVRNSHLAKGWEDIGYHYFIDKAGKITQGRKEDYHGAHAIGYNQKSLGICLAGNFDLTLPTQEQTNSLKGLLSGLRERYNILLDKIIPHRAVANKSCYGNKLPDTWARSLVKLQTNRGRVEAVIDELTAIAKDL